MVALRECPKTEVYRADDTVTRVKRGDTATKTDVASYQRRTEGRRWYRRGGTSLFPSPCLPISASPCLPFVSAGTQA